MTGRLTTTLFVLFLLLSTSAQGQPAWLPDDDTWMTPPRMVEIYTQADGDSAWVYPVSNGEYGRAQDDGDWRFHCPGMLDDDSWGLAVAQDSLRALQGDVSALVESGEGRGALTYVREMTECVDAMVQHLDTLRISGVRLEEGWTYADNCPTSVYNATLHVPDPTLVGASPGDTIAAVTPQGRCAGYGVVRETGATLAAAERNEWTSRGMAVGDTLRLEVYDVSEGVLRRPQARWADPSEVDMCTGLDFCGNGRYATDSFHQLAASTP